MSEPKTRMPLSEIRLTPEYQKLTPKQQLFVAAYVDGGLLDGHYDPIAATRTAYECKTPEVARIMSYSLMANIRIVAVLNRHFQTEPIEEFMVMLDRAINNKKLTVAQLNALKLKCDILGFANHIPTQAPMHAGLQEAQEDAKTARKSKRKPYTPRLRHSQYDDH